MTIAEIRIALRDAGKPVTRETTHTYLRRFKIKPLSRVRQVPQRYPDNAAKKIIRNLGLTPTNGNGHRKTGGRL